MSKRLILIACLALPIGVQATAAPRVEVTRFHIGEPARSGSIAVEEMPGNPDISLEFRTYAAAVAQEWQRVGFTTAASPEASDYVAQVAFRRSFRPTGAPRNDRPVSVGMGGGIGSGGGSGFGLGIGINLSGKPKDVVTTELRIQLRRRSDSAVIWEGRAMTQAREGSKEAQPVAAAQKLSAALIGGYPGESGRTITVK